MEDPVYVASTSASSAPIEAVMPTVGFDIFSAIYNSIGRTEGGTTFLSGGFLSFLDSLWTIFTVLSFTVSIFLLGIYIFAAIRRNLYLGLIIQRVKDEEKLYDDLYRSGETGSKMDDVFKNVQSDNPNDWKLAIIEADVMLDEALKENGFAGGTLGERLQNVHPTQLQAVDDAWEAHKVRNKIAHEGSDFIVTQKLANDTIVRYQRVFQELGII